MKKNIELITIYSISDIPQNMTEREAAEFWGTHCLSEELLEQSIIDDDDDIPKRSPSKTISLRLESDLLHRLQHIASSKGMGYQTLLKQFLIERTYEEERKMAK